VLTVSYSHYAQELRLLAEASRRLVEKLIELDCRVTLGQASSKQPASEPAQQAAVDDLTWERRSSAHQSSGRPGNVVELARRSHGSDLLPAVPIENLAAELLANRNVLAALAGPAIAIVVETTGGAIPIGVTGEDLTRILVNLVKNASEAMTAGGRIRIGLSEWPAAEGAAACTLLTIEDDGPGIAADALDTIFTAGFTTRDEKRGSTGEWPRTYRYAHRGLGLAIARSIVEAAGGRIWATNRAQGGACFSIELPVRHGLAGAASF